MRLFFATDLHGSDICFRKFCEAADFYGCETLIMGGDVTGKLLVPILVEDENATYELGGVSTSVPRSQLDDELRRISNMGYYPVVGDPELLAELQEPDAYERRLLAATLARARRWVEYAESRLRPSGVPILFAPGNDDDLAVDSAFEQSSVFRNVEQEVIRLDGLELASTGWSNPTPWHTPRECSEEELEARLRRLIGRVEDPKQAIFNFHVPPHGTPLDLCPQLDDEFRVVTVGGNPIPIHAGSRAVRTLIEEFQPLVSLHGHIHESRNAVKLGRTFAINPGSEYSEGVLLGALVWLKDGKVKHTLTAG